MKQRWFPLEALIDGARREGRLTLIGMPRDWCGYGALIDAFEAKYGVTVTDVEPGSTSVGQLKALRASRDDPAVPGPDVIDVGLLFGSAARKEGLLQPYKVSTWRTIPEAVKDPDGFWSGHYYGTLAFEVNADVVENAPRDWPDLLKPEYRNAVALAGHPLTAHQGIQAVYAAGLAAAGKQDQATSAGLKFFAELSEKGNFIPHVGTSQTVSTGATPILIRWDYLALGDRDRFAGAPRIQVVAPKTGLVGGVYVQGISATAAHPYAAKLWLEHVYSDESQLSWLKGYGHPIRLDGLVQARKVPAELLERLPEFKEDKPVEPTFPTPEEQERARDTIIKGWDDIVGVKILCEPPPRPRPPTSFNDTLHQPSLTG